VLEWAPITGGYSQVATMSADRRIVMCLLTEVVSSQVLQAQSRGGVNGVLSHGVGFSDRLRISERQPNISELC